ncbi:hypothetical protein ACNKHT_13755 [Shigella flexneri]
MRLVSTGFRLHDNGSLLLDFGRRQFTVSFDETLKPFVRDVPAAAERPAQTEQKR